METSSNTVTGVMSARETTTAATTWSAAWTVGQPSPQASIPTSTVTKAPSRIHMLERNEKMTTLARRLSVSRATMLGAMTAGWEGSVASVMAMGLGIGTLAQRSFSKWSGVGWGWEWDGSGTECITTKQIFSSLIIASCIP
jgi:hypothetical protein